MRGFEVAVVLGDGRAHGFEALDVQVDGAAADGAAAGHGDAGDAGARDERAEHERTGAHGLDDLVFGDGVGEDAALDAGAMLGAAVAEFDLCAHGDKKLALGLDVADLGDVFEDDLIFGEDGGGHAGKRGVFCAGDFDGAEEGVSSAYDKLIHGVSLRELRWRAGGVDGTGGCDKSGTHDRTTRNEMRRLSFSGGISTGFRATIRWRRWSGNSEMR